MPAGGARILFVVVVDYSRLMINPKDQNTVGANLVTLHLQSTMTASLRLTDKLNELVVSDLRHLFFSLSEPSLAGWVEEVNPFLLLVFQRGRHAPSPPILPTVGTATKGKRARRMVENVSTATLVLADQTRSDERDRRKLYRVAHGLTLSDGFLEVKDYFALTIPRFTACVTMFR